MLLASAVGAVGTGSLADRYGRRSVILWTLTLSIPALILFTTLTGPIAFVTGALVGLLAASTAPLLLVLAQQLMRGRAGMASGLILGLGFVTGAIGVPVIGALADAVGIATALRAQVLVLVLAIGIAWLLPSEAKIRALSEPGDPSRAPAPLPAAKPSDVSVAGSEAPARR
jgi:FSR family fosmidomycin resistance protein-like MFS transporter